MWFFLLFLFILGTCFGSFSSVVIHRLKSGKKGAVFGRSECGNCGRILSFKELVPIFSYLFQQGRCAGCKKRVSPVYPALEITSGILFVLSGAVFCDPWLIAEWNLGEIGRLGFFLMISVGAVITAFYDVLYMEIPDEILLPLILIIGLLLGFLPENTELFRHFADVPVSSFEIEGLSNLENAALWAVGIYTFFYLQFLVPAFWHCMKKRKYRDALTVVSYYAILPFVVFLELFKPSAAENRENEEELPTWIGLWDLRIGVFMGFVAGAKIAALGVFIAYLVGSVVGLYVLAVQKRRNVAVPFGPFLIIGLFSSLLWYGNIVPLVFGTPFS